MNYKRIYDETYDALENMYNTRMEVREGQENLMFNVCEAFEKNENVIVEAQVGIGKSFGYLIPGVIISRATNKPLIVASSTIQLTEQLSNDIKQVEKILNIDIECIVGKGATNFPCFKKIQDNLSSEKLNIALDIATRGLTKQQVKNLSLNWDEINADKCMYEKCIHSKDCSFMKMRNQMVMGNEYIRLKGYKPKVIILNQNLLLQHYKNKEMGKKGIICDEPCLIVIDEVHNLEENQRSVYTTSINSLYCIKTLKKAINNYSDSKYYLKYVNELQKWFNHQLIYIKSQKMTGGNIVQTNVRTYIDNSYDNKLKKIIEGLEEIKEKIEFSRLAIFNHQKNLNENELEEINNIIDALKIITTKNDNYVVWSEMVSQNKISISYCPSNPSDNLKNTLFNGDNVVACFSATITDDSNEREKYKYIIESIGFRGYHEKVEKNNFLYEKSRLYIPSKLPNYQNRDARYYKELAKYIYNLSSNNSGGTMVLFTAKDDVLLTFDELKKLSIEKNIYVDGNAMSQNEIIQEFKKTRGIILGTGVFWEGIDLKGEYLTSLIIVRLPFPVPDPVIKRKIELIGDREKVLVPEMIMKLKQGTGRLIRTSNDRGLLTILDSRMNNNNYTHKESILNSIPIKTQISDSDISRFLKTL